MNERDHRIEKEVRVFDFTDGSTLFFSGLGVTLFFIALVFLFAFIARKVEHR